MGSSTPSSGQTGAGRRAFLVNAAKSAGALAVLSLKPTFAKADEARDQPYTVQGIIDTILKDGGLKPFPGTVDTIKAGKPDQVVTGIVTTMFPTIRVIHAAIQLKANFIIAHEPSFYNHRDDTNWVQNNRVLQQKQQLLDQNGVAVWRFHDYCHALRPDAIMYGFVKKTGWLPYFTTGRFVLDIPPLTLSDLAKHLMSTLGIAHARVIGDPGQQCAKIALIPGAAGGQTQVTMLEKEKPDVLIVGEVSEWETPEYIRDELSFGGKAALIVLGHAVSEEPGMEWVAEWLAPKFPGITVTHVGSGDPFTWITSS